MSTTEIPDWMRFDESDDDLNNPIPSSAKSYKFYNDTVEIFFDPGPHSYFKFNAEGKREELDSVTTVLSVIDKPYLKQWAVKLAIESLKSNMLQPDGRIKDFSTEELYAWFEEARYKHKEKLNEAGDIGHIAHNALEDAIQHAIDFTGGVVLNCPQVKDDPYNPAPPENLRKAQNCADRAFEWMVAHNVRWLHTERKTYSLEYNYVGTLDGDALIDSCTDRFCKGCRGRVFKDRRAITDWKSSNQLSDGYAYQTAAYQFSHIEEFAELEIPDRWIMRLGKEEGDFEAWYIPCEYFEADINAFLNALSLYRSLDEIQDRRSAEKKEFTAKVRAIKKTEKEAAELIEKVRKADDREALKKAKQTWDADRKTYYKSLRAGKMAPDAAELMAEERFPKANRPGAKEEATEMSPNGVTLESNQAVTNTVEEQPMARPIQEQKIADWTPIKPTYKKETKAVAIAPQGTWSMRL